MLVLFYETFYERLFDVNPESRKLFTGDMAGQGRMLVKVVSSVVGAVKEPEKVREEMKTLAIRHYHYGVRAIQYGMLGDVLFYALEQVLGAGYTAAHHIAWTRAYCNVLSILVPTAVAIEIEELKKIKTTKKS
jgi:hemoglobin-like flavoprotein